MGIDYISIGNRIKEIRTAKGWTQAKLAEESGVEPLTFLISSELQLNSACQHSLILRMLLVLLLTKLHMVV